jgi:DNA-binding HxlR family transcriptional regulator
MDTETLVIPEKSMQNCATMIMPVRDTLELLSGRWKLPIIISISLGPKRFNQISREVNGITDKMLSKELKDLEVNQMITRVVRDTFPPTVEYSITEHGNSLDPVIHALYAWGSRHRKVIIAK